MDRPSPPLRPCSRTCAVLLIVVAYVTPLVSSLRISNHIVGDPEIQCGSDTVELQFRTDRPFAGKVYVQGQYDRPECRQDYSKGQISNRPVAGIVVPHGSCHMDRQRMINPDNGMQFSAVIVVSFHPTFITEVDRAFHIKCMYRELTKTIETGLDVSMLTTIALSHAFPMPDCRYTIHKDEIDGEVLRYARVGEQVVHRWECSSDIYGLLVHSCYVEDGRGEKVMVVDDNGCHIDDYVLGDPTYTDDLTMAYREAQVIKFADRVTVRFQCQIRLCMKADGGCKGVTPPQCASRRRKASNLIHDVRMYESSRMRDDTENSTWPSRSTASQMYRTTTTGRSTSTSHASTSTTDYNSTEKSVERSSEWKTTKRPSRPFVFLRQHRRRHKRQTPTVTDFKPVDGDFKSQTLYVLETTEDPDKDTNFEDPSIRAQLQSVLQHSLGTVKPGSGRHPHSLNEVCLSLSTFAVLAAAVACVFVSAAFVTSLYCARRLRSHGSSKSSTQSLAPTTKTWMAY